MEYIKVFNLTIGCLLLIISAYNRYVNKKQPDRFSAMLIILLLTL